MTRDTPTTRRLMTSIVVWTTIAVAVALINRDIVFAFGSLFIGIFTAFMLNLWIFIGGPHE